MSSALWCDFDYTGESNGNKQDDEYEKYSWFNTTILTFNSLLYSFNALSAFLSLGVSLFIFSTPRRDSILFQTLGVLFFTTCIFQITEALYAKSNYTWVGGSNATCVYQVGNEPPHTLATFEKGKAAVLYLLGGPTFFRLAMELATAYFRNVVAMFQISLCRVLRQTITDAAQRLQTDRVISLTRILSLVKENYSKPLLVALLLLPIYFFLYNTQICYSNFEPSGRDNENRWNNLVYVLLYPISVVVEFYLPIKSIQINLALYRECIKSYDEAVRMARIKGFLQNRVKENIRLMQGYPRINLIIVSSIVLSSMWKFFVVLIYEIQYKNSMNCAANSYCRWNCYVSGFVYGAGFFMQAIQGTMEYFLYTWNPSTRKWLKLEIEEYKKQERGSIFNYMKRGECFTDCCQRISWVYKNICLGNHRDSQRVTFDSSYYTNDKLYMDDTDEPDAFNNPLQDELDAEINL